MSYRTVCQHAEVKMEVCAVIPLDAKSRRRSSWQSQPSSNESYFDDESTCTATSTRVNNFLRTVSWPAFLPSSSSSSRKSKDTHDRQIRNEKPPRNLIQVEDLCSNCKRKSTDDYQKGARAVISESERARKLLERKLRFRCDKCVKEGRYSRDRSMNDGFCCEFGNAFWTARGYDYAHSAAVPTQVRTRAQAPSLTTVVDTGINAPSTNHLIATADCVRNHARAYSTNSISSTTPSLQVATYTQTPTAPSSDFQPEWRRASDFYYPPIDVERWNSQVPCGAWGTYPCAKDPAPSRPLPALPGKNKTTNGIQRNDAKEGESSMSTSSRAVKYHTANLTPSSRTVGGLPRIPIRDSEPSAPRTRTRTLDAEIASLDNLLTLEMDSWKQLSKSQRE
ncbi:hypothetical protein ACMFMF_004082 [Clarireedia jacksonii]